MNSIKKDIPADGLGRLSNKIKPSLLKYFTLKLIKI